MESKKEKQLQDEELENVSGGATKKADISKYLNECPKCESRDIDVHTEGNGCDAKTVYKCKSCGYEWTK